MEVSLALLCNIFSSCLLRSEKFIDGLTVKPGSSLLEFVESTIEIGKIIEARIESDFGDGFICAYQSLTSLPNTKFVYVINISFSEGAFKKSTKSLG